MACARGRVRRELDPPAGLRDFVDRDRHAPGPRPGQFVRSWLWTLPAASAWRHRLRIGKIELARGPARPARCRLSRRPLRAYRQPGGGRPEAAPATPKTLRATAASSASRLVGRERALVGLGAAIERLGHAAHLLWHRQVAHPHFAEVVVDVRQNRSNTCWPIGRAASGAPPTAAAAAPGAARSCRAGRPRCPAPRNHDRMTGIAPAPRSCHRGRRWWGRARVRRKGSEIIGFAGQAAAVRRPSLQFSGYSRVRRPAPWMQAK